MLVNKIMQVLKNLFGLNKKISASEIAIKDSDNNVYTLDNYLNNRETYSTSEQVIGTWIDGKPIYRKVINSVLNGTYIESGYRFTWINDGVNNIDTIKDVSGLIIYSDRTSPIGKDGNSSICYRNGQGIQIGAIEGMHPYNMQCSVWIEYTKTTD